MNSVSAEILVEDSLHELNHFLEWKSLSWAKNCTYLKLEQIISALVALVPKRTRKKRDGLVS